VANLFFRITIVEMSEDIYIHQSRDGFVDDAVRARPNTTQYPLLSLSLLPARAVSEVDRTMVKLHSAREQAVVEDAVDEGVKEKEKTSTPSRPETELAEQRVGRREGGALYGARGARGRVAWWVESRWVGGEEIEVVEGCLWGGG
jgi:hypothetical protein